MNIPPRVKRLIPYLLAAGVVTAVLFYVLWNQHKTDTVFDDWEMPAAEAETNPELPPDEVEIVIVVDVKGEVSVPGVYLLEEGMRVLDAVEMAGGFTEKGNRDGVNLAQRVSDEMVIYVPAEGEDVMPEMAAPTAGGAGEALININTASQSELENLPGIGPGKAQAIVSYRDEHGSFSISADLINVPGIGERTLEQLEPLIRVK
ncbi:helix-hairpin-helix domain-containing protein [Alteribacter natronophilus]|uniref:helix-hairpin-helix domain-containing protein n=1 Tax=Alteribacter natronophilus TaxID=2583810 RepID=UPI00148724F4|nr:helix-hairpin-helix domain-containing protein [Alteribacter natronophilus]